MVLMSELPASASGTIRIRLLLLSLCIFSIGLGFVYFDITSHMEAGLFHNPRRSHELRGYGPTSLAIADNKAHSSSSTAGVGEHGKRFQGTFADPEVLWSTMYKVKSDHYQIAADQGPSKCVDKTFTWQPCPGPGPSQINASLQHGIFEMTCPDGVAGIYADDMHAQGTEWKKYPGHPVKTDSPAVIARCTRECEKFLDSMHMCPKEDVFLTQALLRPEVASRRVDVNLPLNVLVLFADSSPRADYIASLIRTEKVLREMEEADKDPFTTFTFPFYNVVGTGTKRYFYAALGRNKTLHGQDNPRFSTKEGIPWMWDQFRSHGYATGISTEGCWIGETEDFFGSYPYGGPSEDWGTKWDYYKEMGDYTFMNVFCTVDVDEGSYRRDNTQYDVNLNDDPICLGGDFQSNKFYNWGFQLIDAQERMNKEKHRHIQTQLHRHHREGLSGSKAMEADSDAATFKFEHMEIPMNAYRPNHEHLLSGNLLSSHRQPWFLYHQTMYAHASARCAGMQFTDLQMAKYIRRLHKHGYLNNTVLVLVTDHGNDNFYENPFLSLTVPNWVLNTLPDIGRNLERNQYQLISAYDIYMTLTHLINYPNEYHHPRFDEFPIYHDGGSPPGRSLLSEINQQRDCDDVGVPNSLCCIGQFEVVKMDPEDPEVVKHAMQAVEFVNSETASFRDECHLWTFSRVLEAHSFGDSEVLIYQTRENKGRFKATYEAGRLINVKQLSTWNPNKKCMPNGVRMEYCQCLPITVSD